MHITNLRLKESQLLTVPKSLPKEHTFFKTEFCFLHDPQVHSKLCFQVCLTLVSFSGDPITRRKSNPLDYSYTESLPVLSLFQISNQLRYIFRKQYFSASIQKINKSVIKPLSLYLSLSFAQTHTETPTYTTHNIRQTKI